MIVRDLSSLESCCLFPLSFLPLFFLSHLLSFLESSLSRRKGGRPQLPGPKLLGVVSRIVSCAWQLLQDKNDSPFFLFFDLWLDVSLLNRHSSCRSCWLLLTTPSLCRIYVYRLFILVSKQHNNNNGSSRLFLSAAAVECVQSTLSREKPLVTVLFSPFS